MRRSGILRIDCDFGEISPDRMREGRNGMVCGFLDRVQAFYNKLDKMDKDPS